MRYMCVAYVGVRSQTDRLAQSTEFVSHIVPTLLSVIGQPLQRERERERVCHVRLLRLLKGLSVAVSKDFDVIEAG